MKQPSKSYTPNQENIIDSTSVLDEYFYCDQYGEPIFKTKEIFKQEPKIVFYPYSVNPQDGSVKSKRITKMEFIGWTDLKNIPIDFKITGKYGLRSQRAKSFFSGLYSRFKDVSFYTITLNGANQFKEKHISLNWPTLKNILGEFTKEKISYDREKSYLVNKNLSRINSMINAGKRVLPAGELNRLLNRYDSFEKVNASDFTSLSRILDVIPTSVIKSTSNFIDSKEKINKVYIEDLVNKFEKLIKATKDNEKMWQAFFADNAWILSHLFPFEVILRQKEAYVGGKTFENQDGRIIDFLFQNGFKDNYALLEVKTHKKELLKKTAYRKPAAFAMSEDLSGGISQCLDQKDTFSKDYGNKHTFFDPKCLLIIGHRESMTKEQKACFELIRSNIKNVEIVTFDEVLLKLKGLAKVLSFQTS